MRGVVRIGTCQTPEILGDVDAAVRCIRGFCEQAEREGADLLLFPECFLQGYLITDAHVLHQPEDAGDSPYAVYKANVAKGPRSSGWPPPPGPMSISPAGRP
jgi:predicted amidohydrolase